MKFQMVRQFLGLRKLHNRSILDVCEDCAIECNDKIVYQINFTKKDFRAESSLLSKKTIMRRVLGLCRLSNRSILDVCEDCEIKHNDKIAH